MSELSEVLELNTIAKLKVVNGEIIINSYEKEFRQMISNNKQDLLSYLTALEGHSTGYINSDVFGIDDLKVNIKNYEHYSIHEFMIKTIEKALETLADFSLKEESAIFIISSYKSQNNILTVSAGFEDDIPVTLFELTKFKQKDKSQEEVHIKKEIKYRFDQNTRYITKGIKEELSVEIQLIIWGIVDRLVNSGIPADYLQVFDLEFKENTLAIKHSQEVPQYISLHEHKLLEQNENKELKVYVIDDRDHSTMLLASEYQEER